MVRAIAFANPVDGYQFVENQNGIVVLLFLVAYSTRVVIGRSATQNVMVTETILKGFRDRRNAEKRLWIEKGNNFRNQIVVMKNLGMEQRVVIAVRLAHPRSGSCWSVSYGVYYICASAAAFWIMAVSKQADWSRKLAMSC